MLQTPIDFCLVGVTVIFASFPVYSILVSNEDKCYAPTIYVNIEMMYLYTSSKKVSEFLFSSLNFFFVPSCYSYERVRLRSCARVVRFLFYPDPSVARFSATLFLFVPYLLFSGFRASIAGVTSCMRSLFSSSLDCLVLSVDLCARRGPRISARTLPIFSGLLSTNCQCDIVPVVANKRLLSSQ